jgi:hypothetical protein
MANRIAALALAKRHCWFSLSVQSETCAARASLRPRNKKPGAVSRPGICVVLDRARLIGDSRYVVNHG